MLPDLSVLIALLLGLMSLSPGPADPMLAVGGTVGMVLVGVAMVRMAGERAARAIEEDDLPGAILSTRWASLWPLLAWAGALQFFGWGAWVAVEVPRIWWLARIGFLLLPALVVFASAWVVRSRIEALVQSRRGRTVRPPAAAEAIRHHLRRNGLALVPVLLVTGLLEGIWCLGEAGVAPLATAALWLEAMPLLALSASMGILALLTLLLPRLLKRFLRAEPLADGPLKTRIEAAARAMKLAYGHLLVWRTGGRVLNAMVVGLTGRTRAIVFTDGLLQALPEEEVLAVFAHEAGHARRHHLTIFLACFFALALLFEVVAGRLQSYDVSPILLTFAFLAATWFLLLGWVSRRFERDADVFGAEHAAASAETPPEPIAMGGLPEPLPFGVVQMMRALDRVQRISGTVASHRHGSIEERIRFLALHATNPEVREAHRRSRRGLAFGLGAAVLVVAAVVVAEVPGALRIARATVAAERGQRAYREAEALLEEGESGKAAGSWAEALARFREAERIAAESDDRLARRHRAFAAFHVAQVLVHGAADREAALPALRAALDRIRESELPAETRAILEFLTRTDLGRVEAGLGQIAEARASLHVADALAAALPASEQEVASARRRLLEATIEGAAGDRVRAAAALTRIEEEARGRSGANWAEVRRAAREERERLPPG